MEAQYVVGEYEIVILSAEQSASLFTWLNDNGYHVPGQSIDLLQEYIDEGQLFLAAKVSEDAGIQSGDMLSPLQLRYTSAAFQIPIRLGTLNAKEEQDLVIYAISEYQKGAVGISNALYNEFTIEDECMWESQGEEFGEYYSNRFADAYEAQNGPSWITEYAWGGGNCDPCSGTPPGAEDLVSLGLNEDRVHFGDYFFTRLHMRYKPQDIDQDLTLYQNNLFDQIQQRYIIYDKQLEDRFPVCDEGMVEDPGSCDADPNSDNNNDNNVASQSCGGCDAGAGSAVGLWLLGSLFGVGRRRRKTC